MHLVTVTFSGSGRPQVAVLAQGEEPTTTEEELDEGPSPILPEGKELLWSAGAFVVLAILVRLFLFPRIKKGMDARHELIRGDLLDTVADVARGAPAEATLVIFHSAVLAYVSIASRRDFTAIMGELPAVWISNEAPGVVASLGAPNHGPADVESDYFMVGQGPDQAVALADPHGLWVEWLAA